MVECDKGKQNHIKQMKQSSEDQLEKITFLLKIVKGREQLYLQLLNFVTKNIESSSSHHQQLNLFTKFLTAIKLQQKQILPQEKDILAHFDPEDDSSVTPKDSSFVTHVTRNNKQILRLCSRLIQILDASISKIRNSLFNQNGRLSLEFSRWKKNLHNIVKGETVHLGEFINHVLNYVRIKYKKQLAKVQKYIFKLESGATIALKDLYLKEKSDDTDPEPIRYTKEDKEEEQKAEHGSETDSPNKRSLKKSLLKTTKKGHKLFKSTKKEREISVHSDTKPPKEYTASKLLKHYNMMELSKKQFLQDFIYQKNEQEEHKKRLMSSLMERNKTISVQINTYYKKSLVYQEKIKQLNNFLSSGEQKEPDRSSKQKKSSDQMSHSILKNNSLRKSFVISKRKSSLNFEKSSKILTQHDESSRNDIFIKTMKNFPNKRKTSAQTTQRSINKSKKLFVIKSPVVFEDDNIPQAPVINTGGGGWFRAPLTNRKPDKKTENLRLKRRNNPLPIQNSLFNESFKFTDNKF